MHDLYYFLDVDLKKIETPTGNPDYFGATCTFEGSNGKASLYLDNKTLEDRLSALKSRPMPNLNDEQVPEEEQRNMLKEINPNSHRFDKIHASYGQ